MFTTGCSPRTPWIASPSRGAAGNEQAVHFTVDACVACVKDCRPISGLGGANWCNATLGHAGLSPSAAGERSCIIDDFAFILAPANQREAWKTGLPLGALGSLRMQAPIAPIRTCRSVRRESRRKVVKPPGIAPGTTALTNTDYATISTSRSISDCSDAEINAPDAA